MQFIFTQTNYFEVFLMLSLIVMFSGFLYNAHFRRGIAFEKVTAVFAFAVVLLFTGAKLFAIDLEQWKDLFFNGHLPALKGMTAMGALVFGPLGIIVGSRLFNIKGSITDLIAIPMLLSLGVQRIGCLFAGCCHGIETGSPFSVSYGPGTRAYEHFYSQWTFDGTHAFTPALHPVAIYFLIAALTIAFVLFKVRHSIKASGNLFVAAKILYLFSRFFIEFFRKPEVNTLQQKLIGVSLLQWLMLAYILVATYLFVKRERAARIIAFNDPGMSGRTRAFSIGFSCIVLILVHSSDIFSKMQLNCIHLFLVPSILVSSYQLLADRYRAYYQFRVSIVAIFAFIFILNFQSQEQKQGKKWAIESGKQYSFSEFSAGYAQSSFIHYHQDATTYYHTSGGDGCSAPQTYRTYSYPKNFRHDVNGAGISYSHLRYSSDHSLFLKFTLGAGRDRDNDPSHADNKKHRLPINYLNSHLAVGVACDVGGVEVGGHFGQYRSADIDAGEHKNSRSSGDRTVRAFPSLRAWTGYNVIHGELRCGMTTYGLNGVSYPITLGLGSNLGRHHLNNIRVGVGLAGSDPLLNAGFKMKVWNSTGIEVDAGFSKSPYLQASVFQRFNKKIKTIYKGDEI